MSAISVPEGPPKIPDVAEDAEVLAEEFSSEISSSEESSACTMEFDLPVGLVHIRISFFQASRTL